MVQLVFSPRNTLFGPIDNDLDWSKSNGPSGFGPRNTVTQFRKYCTIYVAKTKALISCAVTLELIYAIVFAYAKKQVSS